MKLKITIIALIFALVAPLSAKERYWGVEEVINVSNEIGFIPDGIKGDIRVVRVFEDGEGDIIPDEYALTIGKITDSEIFVFKANDRIIRKGVGFYQSDTHESAATFIEGDRLILVWFPHDENPKHWICLVLDKEQRNPLGMIQILRNQ